VPPGLFTPSVNRPNFGAAMLFVTAAGSDDQVVPSNEYSPV